MAEAKGMRKGKVSTGLGFGRRKNPIDKKTGKIMECHSCGSDEHLIADCDRKRTSDTLMTSGATSSAGYGLNREVDSRWFGLVED